MGVSTRTIATLTDDLTAKVTDLPDASQAAEIKLSVNGKVATLATTKEIADALTAFVASPSDATLRAVGDLGVFPRTPPTSTGSGKVSVKYGNGAEAKIDRADFEAWAKPAGHKVADRGSQSAATLRAWAADHAAPAA